ncbi:hypothetical protein PA10_00051 [Pseudomonas phage pPa_SNUABM_DT01]|nr:hypothetical protein PA10_00051 [Pseudomonas phage pPa_SNUABM_DT01]
MSEILVVELRRGKLGKEEQLLVDMANELGIEVQTTYEKVVSRNQFAFNENHIVAGGVQFIKHALRAYGKELPVENSYPECLHKYLKREVRKVRTLREAKAMLDEGRTLFIKPCNIKRFTGFVTCDRNDFRFNGASDQTPVWISEPVQFDSEWRCYVANGIIVGVEFTDNSGMISVKPHVGVIYDAVRILTENGGHAGYAIDFGVLKNGQTVLVELNDGFSIGAYGDIDPEAYWEVIRQRWKEMIR